MTDSEILRLHADAGVAVHERNTRAGDVPGRNSVPRSARPRGDRDWNRLLTWSLSLTILVFIGRVQEAIPGVPDIQLGNIAVILGVVGMAQLGYLRDAGRILATPQGRLALGFIGVAAFSIPFALWPGGALQSFLGFLRVSVLGVMIVIAVRRPKHLMHLTTVFVISAAILVNAYIVDWLVGGGVLTEQEFVAFDRNDVALLSVMAFPFALSMTIKGGVRYWAGFMLAGFLALGVVATDSRGGFLALAATGGLMLFNSKILSAGKKAMLVGVGVAVLMFGGSAEYWERIEAVFTEPSADYNFTSRDGRIEIWKRGIGYFLQNPLTGVGIGNFPVAEGEGLDDQGFGVKWNTAHNAYVLAAAELGIGGIVLFIAILLSVSRQAKRSSRVRCRGREPPDNELVAVADATKYSVVGYSVAAIFLSATFSVSFVFLVAIGASLHLLTRVPVPAPVRLTEERLKQGGFRGR